jgi:hypothetical protein
VFCRFTFQWDSLVFAFFQLFCGFAESQCPYLCSEVSAVLIPATLDRNKTVSHQQGTVRLMFVRLAMFCPADYVVRLIQITTSQLRLAALSRFNIAIFSTATAT